jgi:pre-rRNA-processing protein TSR3
LILRDPRESVAKCSLTPLRGLPGIEFVAYRRGARLDAGARVLLDPDGDELSAADRGRGLLLIDCAWRHLPELRASVDGELLPRRLPPLVTAYPRKSKVYADPARGLASVEALYAALFVLDGPRPELLRGYHWAERFLELNPSMR